MSNREDNNPSEIKLDTVIMAKINIISAFRMPIKLFFRQSYTKNLKKTKKKLIR